jgi:hypothetical protein
LSAISIPIAIASPPAIEVAVVLLAVQGIGPVLCILVGELTSRPGCKVTEVLGEIAFVVAIGRIATEALEKGLEVVGQITIYAL